MKLKSEYKREHGAITIEAIISLSTFMFAIVTLLAIVNICLVQAKIGIAINTTAKELSQYSYLYATTGLNKSHEAIADGAKGTQDQIDGVIGDVGTVFTEIQNIGQKTEKIQEQDISSLLDEIETSGNNIQTAGISLKSTFEEIAKDPKQAAMGLAKILANDGWNLAMSFVAEGLSKGLCQKNLIAEKGGSVESYLKSLGVVPSSTGSYLDGLDFSGSTIFPSGSSEIRVRVSYDVKVIALLPIDFSFHFCQTAITHGWLTGEDSYKSSSDKAQEMVDNKTLWTESTNATERQSLIRHMVINDLREDGYEQVTGSKKGDSYQDIHVYNGSTNQFAVIHSMNPLYSAEGEKTVTLDDLNATVIANELEHMCAGISSTVNSLDTIKTKTPSRSGDVSYTEYKCDNATAKVILVVPQDEGLKEYIEGIAAGVKTNGVIIEVQASYGNGANTSEATTNEGGNGE